MIIKNSESKRESYKSKNKQNIILINISIFFLFLLMTFLMHWSIVLGENVMIGDIYAAEYPFQVLASEAISHHTFPLWNSLMQYGAPTYATVGTPIWYLPTLILALGGYTLISAAICYVMHIAIGGFGMYLLARQELRQRGTLTTNSYIVSFLIGTLYCGCGVFLSNAQHIMIIISAAWIPYVFFFLREYLDKKKIIFALCTGGCASQIFLGGYPEMFFDLFLYMIPYTLYIGYKKENTVWKNIISCARKYISICLMTVMASAITLLPFLKNMGLITRGNGLGQIPNYYSEITFLTALFPKASKFMYYGANSMDNYYIGIITLILLATIITRKYKNKKIYLFLAAIATLMCMGRASVIHTLLYRFMPMYSSFRFPTLNRIFVTLFLLLALTPILFEIIEVGKIEKRTLCIIAFLFGIIAILGSIVGIGSQIKDSVSEIQLQKEAAFAESAIVLCEILVLYFIVFLLIYKKQLSAIWRKVLIITVILIEVFSWSFFETPLSIAKYQPGQYSWDQVAKDDVDNEWNQYNSRHRGINFAGHMRSTSGNNSKKVVFNQTFDEEGYVSFVLSAADEFRKTYNRSIIETNPVAYFTNNVKTEGDLTYEEWSNKCDVSPDEVYADQALNENVTEYSKLEPEIASIDSLDIKETENGIAIAGEISAGENKTNRVRLYLSDSVEESIPVDLAFTDSEGTTESYSGNYAVQSVDGEKYIDIYLPSVEKTYQQIQCTIQKNIIDRAAQVQTKRMTSDEYVDVSWFAFNSIEMTVDAPTEGYVALLQSKHDGWTAYVDGKEQDINLLDNTFMGIHVTEGRHTIVMKFRPKELFVGAAITVMFWCVLVGTIIGYWLKRRHIR